MKKIKLLNILMIKILIWASCSGGMEKELDLNFKSLPNEIVKVNVAIYDKKIIPENLVFLSTINPAVNHEITVPVGDDKIFVITAQDSSGLITYRGISEPIDINIQNESVTLDIIELAIEDSNKSYQVKNQNDYFFETKNEYQGYFSKNEVDSSNFSLPLNMNSSEIEYEFARTYEYKFNQKFNPFSSNKYLKISVSLKN